MKKILGSFRNNIGLKLISILVAIVIWYMVVDINDPVETATYTVKVTVENEAYIANGKQIYHIDDANKTVGVTLKANRSTLKNIKEDNITVTADLTQIVDMDRDPVMVPLTAACKSIPASNITLSKTAIPITIETIASKSLAVAVDTGESMPSEEYEVGRMTVSPDQIVVKGPESIINQIDSAVAQIDVTGMTIDSTRTAKLILLDKNQNEISEDTISDDLTFEGAVDGGTPNITVYVELWRRRSDVKMEIAYSGEPASGYYVAGVATTPETITVVGNTEALQNLTLDANTIHIDTGTISVEGATDNVTAVIELAEVLPPNTRLARNTAEEATVTITILSDQTKELSLDVDTIQVENLNPNLTVSYGQAELPIRVRGYGSVIENVTEEDIAASIDLEGQTTGEVTVPVTFTMPSGVSLDEEVTIDVSLKEIVTQEAPGEDTGEQEED